MKYLLLILVFVTAGCSQLDVPPRDYYMNAAVILSHEPVISDCKGGYVINVLGHSTSGHTFYAQELPITLNRNQTDSFPVKVMINWAVDSITCPVNDTIDFPLMKISKLKIIE